MLDVNEQYRNLFQKIALNDCPEISPKVPIRHPNYSKRCGDFYRRKRSILIQLDFLSSKRGSTSECLYLDKPASLAPSNIKGPLAKLMHYHQCEFAKSYALEIELSKDEPDWNLFQVLFDAGNDMSDIIAAHKTSKDIVKRHVDISLEMKSHKGHKYPLPEPLQPIIYEGVLTLKRNLPVHLRAKQLFDDFVETTYNQYSKYSRSDKELINVTSFSMFFLSRVHKIEKIWTPIILLAEIEQATQNHLIMKLVDLEGDCRSRIRAIQDKITKLIKKTNNIQNIIDQNTILEAEEERLKVYQNLRVSALPQIIIVPDINPDTASKILDLEKEEFEKEELTIYKERIKED